MIGNEPDEIDRRCPTCGAALPEASDGAAVEGLAAGPDRSSAAPVSCPASVEFSSVEASPFEEDTEITKAMVQAGVDEMGFVDLSSYLDDPYDIVTRVFLAMVHAQDDRASQTRDALKLSS